MRKFSQNVWRYYRFHRRNFPWRPPALKFRKDGTARDPYRVFISEIMLQQTQTSRVEQKYVPFIRRFPNFQALARSPLRNILKAWQGLGYNRRALLLQKAARIIVRDYGGKLPRDPLTIQKLPGVGQSSAGAVCAFAFGIRTPFIETNIRRAYIHYFFPRRKAVRDRDIIPIVEQTLRGKNFREWYYALMDYGAMLGKAGINPNVRSAHYAKQSPFAGSDRELRGKIVAMMVQKKKLEPATLARKFGERVSRIRRILHDLKKEGFFNAL